MTGSVRDQALAAGDAEAMRAYRDGKYVVKIEPSSYGVGVRADNGRFRCAYGVAWAEIDEGGKGVVADYVRRAVADIERQIASLRTPSRWRECELKRSWPTRW